MMKQAIVLGFKTRDKSELGKVVLLTGDKDAARKEVNDPKGGFARKEMYILALASKRKCFVEVVETPPEANPAVTSDDAPGDDAAPKRVGKKK